MKILVIRFSSIGDIVLTTPVIRCLKLQVNNATLHVATKKAFANIFENNVYVDKVFALENKGEKQLIEALLPEQYDTIIDLHNNLRSLQIKKAFKGVPNYSFNKLNIQKWLYTTFKINKLPQLHIVDRYMETVKDLGVINDGEGLDYFIPAKDEVPLTDIPTSHQLGYIGLVIGAALKTKQLPLHKLVIICKQINYPIILLGGKEDVSTALAIEKEVNHLKVYNACGKFNLNESAYLVKKAKLIITHDTGLMHIAAAFNVPIVSIWGNTVPAFGMTAYYSKTATWHFESEVMGLRCRPCSKIGYAACPRGHFKCMEQQNEKKIVEIAENFLKRN
jgi:ADP-heptose:LPS heptosyltransferase